MYQNHPDFKPFVPVSEKQLRDSLDQPVIDTSMLKEPIRIKSFALYRKNGNWFLKVTGRNGEEGTALCSERAEYLYPLLKRFLQIIVGGDARELEKLLEKIYLTDINYKIQGLAYWCCISWIEAAVLDMLGKAADLPVTSLLGGRNRDEIELYVASGNRMNTPQEEVEFLQALVEQTGARAVKFKLGGRMSRNKDSIAGRTEGLLSLARKHFGEDFVIHVDGNGSYDAQKGIEIGRIAESIQAYFYEEPCPFDDLWDTKKVADELEIPLAFGEQETSLRRFAWIVEKNAAQVLQPDLQYTGGFIQCLKVARMAALAGMPVTPHVSGGYAAYNALLFCAVIPNAGHYHEYKGFGDLGNFVPGGLKVKDGRIRIPEGKGLGIDFSGFALSEEDVVYRV